MFPTTRFIHALFVVLVLALPATALAKKSLTEQAQPIVEEAWKLYRSEMASWQGTDLFNADAVDRSQLGGYLSYSEGINSRCIFYTRDSIPKVIWSVSFDSSYSLETAIINRQERRLTPVEQSLYQIRQATLELVQTDTFFQHFENSNYNIIPLIEGGERKVYILTGSSKNGVVLFGNDYLLTYDASGRLKTKRRLHNNLLAFPFGPEAVGGKEAESAVHSHLPSTGEFMTATDICTLMLYAKYTGWKQHIVVGPNSMNIWNCESRKLLVLPKNVYENIMKDQDKRQATEAAPHQ